MRRITKEEAINTFNEILKGSKLPQKELEFNPKLNIVIARNRFGTAINKWYVKDDADPIMMIRDICNLLLVERR